jgi:hypothetical protein
MGSRELGGMTVVLADYKLLFLGGEFTNESFV